MRRIRFLLFALLVLFALPLKATIVPVIIWDKILGNDINNLSLSPDGVYLAVGTQGDTNTGMLVNPTDGSTIKYYNDYASSCQLKFSPTGKYLIITGNGFTIYNFATGDTVLKIPYAKSISLAMSPDETKFVVGTVGRLDFWDLTTKSITDSIIYFVSPSDDPQHAGYKSVDKVTYSADGKYVAFFSEKSGNMELIDATTHSSVFRYSSGGWSSKIAFSPNGKYMVFSARHDPYFMSILDLDSMKIVDNLNDGPYDIIFTKDSKNILYSGTGTDYFVKKYNLFTKELITLPGLDKGGFRSMQLSNNENILYVHCGDLYAVDISSSMGVEEIANTKQLSLNITDSQDTLNLNFSTTTVKELTIKIVDIEGQVVKTFGGISTGNTFTGSYNISDLASGTYILTVSGSGISGSCTFNIAR